MRLLNSILDLDSKKFAKIPGIYKYFNPHQCKIEYGTNKTKIQSAFLIPLLLKFYLTMNLEKTIHNFKTSTNFRTVTGQGTCPVYFHTD